jgi:hypothetical protein
VTDLAFEDLCNVPSHAAEVALTSEAKIQAGWRTEGIPLVTDKTAGRLPMLAVVSGGNRLVIGFGPHALLGPEHVALADYLAAATGLLALEVNLWAQNEVLTDGLRRWSRRLGAHSARRSGRYSSWVHQVHLQPGQTQVRVYPCDDDVPWLDIASGDALCSITFDVEQITELRHGHAAVASGFALAAEAFARDVRNVADEGWLPELQCA